MLAISTPGLGQIPEAVHAPLLLVSAALAIGVLAIGSVKLTASELLLRKARWARALGGAGGLPGPATTFSALAAYSLNYLIIGAGLWWVARAAELPLAIDLSLTTAAFALAWILGFLAPGAPAGLGVRESIMLLLLAGAAPEADLLLFVLLARVVTMLGDAICFAVGWLDSKWDKASRSPNEQ
jgi:hypothetical protein